MNLNELQNLMDDLAHEQGPSESDLESREDELCDAFDAHPEWMEQMRARDEFDVKLCEVMPEVEVPAGLKERLLTSLDEPPMQPEPVPAADRHRRLRRRALELMTISGAAVMVTIAVLMVSRTPSLKVDTVTQELPRLWDATEDAFNDADPDQAVLPSGPWNSNRLRFPHGWKTRDISGESLVFSRLEFISDRGRLHTGLLASLPFSAVNQPQSTNPFSSGEILYLKTGSGSMLAIVTWTDATTERVYFLAVPAADHTLEALEELLMITPV